MKSVLSTLLNDSRHSLYHMVSLSIFLVGFFVTFTATDLGPFAPLLVSGGIYLVAFSIMLQTVFWLKAGLRKVFESWLVS